MAGTRRGFTPVELSTVLVVIGLILGGVLAGDPCAASPQTSLGIFLPPVSADTGNALLCRGGQPGEQITACTALIGAGKGDLAVEYAYRAYGYCRHGELDKGIADFTRAIALAPSGESYAMRGDAFAQKGDYRTALADYQKAIRVDPSLPVRFPDYYNNRGNAYLAQGQYRKAIDDYSKAIWFKPGYAHAYHYRALARRKAGDIEGGDADAATAQGLGFTDDE